MPRILRSPVNSNKPTGHVLCGCGLDLCRWCNPEYICQRCGLAPAELGDSREVCPADDPDALDFEDSEAPSIVSHLIDHLIFNF